MRATVQAALAAGVRVGAHPSYPDRAGFGRVAMELSADELWASLTAQLAALIEVASALGTTVSSVKPHGALYGEVARGGTSCDVLLGVMGELCDPGTALVLPSGAPGVTRAQEGSWAVLREGFCDRAYTAEGALVARHEPGAVYDDPARAAAQARGLAEDGTVHAVDGVVLTMAVDTLCVHGDSPNAVPMARAVRTALEAAGVTVTAPMTLPR
jgi:UPF0271 protein